MFGKGEVVDKQRLSRKEVRQEVKQPDQFMVYSVQTVDWVRQHTTYLVYGIIGALAAIAVVVLWVSWQRQHEQKASVQLHEATKFLRTPGENVATPPEKVLAQLQAIVRDYGRTQAAVQAHWYLGQVYFEQGRYPEALAAYEQARRLGASDPQRFMSALVTLNIGYAQEATKAYERALSSFEAVLQSSAHWLHGEAYLGMGRCHERTGATEKAVALYQRALADAAVSEAVRRSLEERLSLLQPQQAVPVQGTAASGKS